MTGDCCNNVLTISVPLRCKFLLTVLKETCVEKLPIMVKKKKKGIKANGKHSILYLQGLQKHCVRFRAFQTLQESFS